MRKELKILLLACSMFLLAGGLFGPIYAVFVEEIGGDLLTAGAAYGVFSIVAGVVIYFISRWEDKVKHQEKLVVMGYGLRVLGFAGYLLITRPLELFIVQIIFGIGEAIGIPAYDGLYSNNLDKGKFTSQWGAWESMAYITLGVSALVGGYLANIYGFRLLFVIMLILSIFGFISSLFLLAKKEKRSRKKYK